MQQREPNGPEWDSIEFSNQGWGVKKRIKFNVAETEPVEHEAEHDNFEQDREVREKKLFCYERSHSKPAERHKVIEQDDNAGQ